MALVAEHLSKSAQPLVPERMFVSGAGGTGSETTGQGLLGQLIGLLVAEKSGFALAESNGNGNGAELKEFADRMSKEAMASMESAVALKQRN
jgi:hypothetical protein